MTLLSLDPQWIDHDGRHGLGVSFRCMTGHCTGRQWILFANPLDGGPAYDKQCHAMMLDKRDAGETFDVRDRPCGMTRWRRIGDDFATMSLSPSVDAHECGHLTLTNGVFG